ncbi:MAG TPA: sensor histidine kinase [Candidatus Dietzia intestinigallinarum]|nr:sensor histidine kinase [Candidatus Dietzia intestinigallinarum]
MTHGPAEAPGAGRDDDPTDLDSLLGLRSVKRSFFDQYRAAESRLRRSMHALDRVSGALVRTAEGPEELMRSVLRVAYDQLDAQWSLVALRDGQLPSVEPRHLLIDPEGRFVAFEGRDLAPVPSGMPEAVVNALLAMLRGGRTSEVAEAGGGEAVTVPLVLHGGVIGGLASWRRAGRSPDDIDAVVLRILAGQAAVALHNSVLFRDKEMLLARAEEAYEEARGHVVELSRRNSELEIAHRELDAAHRQRILDVERSRMARELHDSVSQLVLGAGMHLQLGLDAVDRPDEQRPLLEQAVHLTDQAVDQLRSVIYALRTIDMGDGRLSRLIEDLCRLHVPSTMTTQVEVVGEEFPTDPGIEHELLRITGEALSNAVRHSRAGTVVVTLEFAEEAVGLTIADDGEGRPEHLRRVLDDSRVDQTAEHQGLVNMTERAELVGGRLRIADSTSGGVAITVVAPREGGPAERRSAG